MCSFFHHNGIETQQATRNSNEIDCGDRRSWKEWNYHEEAQAGDHRELWEQDAGDGKLEDCTEESLQELIQQDESDDEE